MAKVSELVAQEWQRKERKTEEEKLRPKKRLEKARGQTRVNIGMDFSTLPRITEGAEWLKSDAVSINNSHAGGLRSV